MASTTILNNASLLPQIETMEPKHTNRMQILGNLSVAMLDTPPSWASCFGFIFNLFWKPLSDENGMTLYVNLNSVEKRLGISSSQAKLLLQRNEFNSADAFQSAAKEHLDSTIHVKAEKSLRKHLSSTDATNMLTGLNHHIIQTNIQLLQHQVNQDGIPRHYQRRESGLPRTLLVTQSGVYVLLNRKKGKDDRPIGQGTYKKVYKAININTGEKAAYYSIEVRNNDEALTSEFQHFNSLGDITCRPVTQAYSLKHNRKNLSEVKICYLMTKMKGDLISAVDRHLVNFERKKVRINAAKQMATLVAHYNERGCVHRDIKPDNFLFSIIDNKIVIRLIDFGLAIRKHVRIAAQAGSFMYASPQVLNDTLDIADEKDDSWQLGMTLARLFYDQLDQQFLSSSRYFDTYTSLSDPRQMFEFWENIETAARQWQFEEPENKHSLEYVIYKLLQVNPEDRWTPAEAAHALAEIERRS
ncbi:MAG: protein kinase [Rhabdochlamydiaceae bacterium]|nr:protein kinase [Rhabdochlamydiaceae bacterium]